MDWSSRSTSGAYCFKNPILGEFVTLTNNT
jgi:hypothetical protein